MAAGRARGFLVTLSVSGDKLVGDPEVVDNRPVGYYANNESDWRSLPADEGVDAEALLEMFAATPVTD